MTGIMLMCLSLLNPHKNSTDNQYLGDSSCLQLICQNYLFICEVVDNDQLHILKDDMNLFGVTGASFFLHVFDIQQISVCSC
jgi:hypothetical protein